MCKSGNVMKGESRALMPRNLAEEVDGMTCLLQVTCGGTLTDLLPLI